MNCGRLSSPERRSRVIVLGDIPGFDPAAPINEQTILVEWSGML